MLIPPRFCSLNKHILSGSWASLLPAPILSRPDVAQVKHFFAANQSLFTLSTAAFAVHPNRREEERQGESGERTRNFVAFLTLGRIVILT